MRRTNSVLIALGALLAGAPAAADGLTLVTPGGPATQGQCRDPDNPALRVPCVLQDRTWTRILRPTDDGGSLKAAGAGQIARSLADRLSDTLNVKDFGAIGDGASHPLSQRFGTLAAAQAVYGPYATSLSQEIDTVAEMKAIDRACSRGGGLVYLPQGNFRRDRTVTVPCYGVRVGGAGDGPTTIRRKGDFGPTYYFGGASGYISAVSLSDMQLVDDDGSMTIAASPQHVVMEGLSRAEMTRVTAASGTGVLSILASDQVRVAYVYGYLRDGVATQTVGGTTYDRTGFYVGASSKSVLAPYNAQSSDIFFTSVNVKGRTPTEGGGNIWHVAYGLHITAVDGFWMADSHFEGTLKANVRLQRTTTGPLGNVYVRNTMSDIAAAHGWLVDGAYPITRVAIEGQISADLQGNAGGNGFYLTGTGGADDLALDLGVEGVKGDGIKIDASNVTGVAIRPKSIKRLVSGSTGINISSGSRISVTGGVIGGDSTMSNGLVVQNASRVAISGVNITYTLSYGYYITNAAHVSVVGGLASNTDGYGGFLGSTSNYITIVGVEHVDNATGPINDGMVACRAAETCYGILANNLGM